MTDFKLLGLQCSTTETLITTVECDVMSNLHRFDLAVLDDVEMDIIVYRKTTVPALYAYGLGTLRAALRACARDEELFTIFLRRSAAEDVRESVDPSRVVVLRYYEPEPAKPLPPRGKSKS